MTVYKPKQKIKWIQTIPGRCLYSVISILSWMARSWFAAFTKNGHLWICWYHALEALTSLTAIVSLDQSLIGSVLCLVFRMFCFTNLSILRIFKIFIVFLYGVFLRRRRIRWKCQRFGSNDLLRWFHWRLVLYDDFIPQLIWRRQHPSALQ